jgi:hypothetical protein
MSCLTYANPSCDKCLAVDPVAGFKASVLYARSAVVLKDSSVKGFSTSAEICTWLEVIVPSDFKLHRLPLEALIPLVLRPWQTWPFSPRTALTSTGAPSIRTTPCTHSDSLVR